MMKTILVVDDDPVTLALCSATFAIYKDEFSVITASNGYEALQTLKQQPVDLLLTDLYMPVLDGFVLLAQVSRAYPKMMVAVMSAYEQLGNLDLIKKAGALLFLSKPIDLERLLSDVRRLLSQSAEGYVRGITLFGLAQLLNMEKKTATVTVKSRENTGQLFFVQGELIHAGTQDAKGEAAAYQIFSWDDWEIWLDQHCVVNNRTIQAPLQNVMLEAARKKDETNKPPGADEEIEFDLTNDPDNLVKKQLFSMTISLAGAVADLPSELDLTLQGDGLHNAELSYKTNTAAVSLRKPSQEKLEAFLHSLSQLLVD
jgi:CheY-like chemotaxis protein